MKDKLNLIIKKTFIFCFFFLNYTFINCQNYFYIGEKSYPCTETFNFNSNHSSPYSDDLDILIAKDTNKGLIAVSKEMNSSTRIKGKLLIYLDNGTVISCVDRNINDHVNGVGTTVYYLTIQELNKMSISNVNSIRYSVQCSSCISSSDEGNFAVKNERSKNYYGSKVRVNVPRLVRALYF